MRGGWADEAVNELTSRRWEPRERRESVSPSHPGPASARKKAGPALASVEAGKPDHTSSDLQGAQTRLDTADRSRVRCKAGGAVRRLEPHAALRGGPQGTTKKEVGWRADSKIDPNSHMTPQPLHLPKQHLLSPPAGHAPPRLPRGPFMTS